MKKSLSVSVVAALTIVAALIIRANRIEHALYPVFPPNESAEQTLDWLKTNPLA